MNNNLKSNPWPNNRRFNSYTEYFRKHFGERVQKVTIDAGFTCPNRDGTKGFGGCTYCNNDSFNPSYCLPNKSITQQISEGIEFHANRYRRAEKFLAYFQAYSNTYATIDQLKKLYNEALAFPGIIGLVIGTRPDCMDDEKLEYFSELAKKHYLIIEYGVESCYNHTLDRINRKHTFEESALAIEKTVKYGIKTGAHFIFGLPGETHKDMLDEISLINKLPIDNIKFHQLLIVKDTPMALDYQNDPGQFTFFSMDEYIDFFIQVLERLNPAFMLERFTSEVPPRFQAGPNWGLIRTHALLKKLENRLESLDTWQGKYFVENQ